MLQHLKTEVQNYQIKHCEKKYEKEVKRQTNRYASWNGQKENDVTELVKLLEKEHPEYKDKEAEKDLRVI